MEKDRQDPASPNHNKNHAFLKFALVILVIAAATILIYKTGLLQFFLSKHRLARFLESLGSWSFAGFIVLQALQVVVAPIPGDVTGLIGGYVYGPWLGILYSTVGLTLGSYVAFALSRAYGKPFVKKFVPAQTMARFNFLLHHKGAYIVFLMFLIPGFPKDYLCYILGLGELSSLEFVLLGGVGRLFGTVLLTLGGNYIRLHKYVQFGVVCGVALVITFIALAYKDKVERWFRSQHLRNLKKNARLKMSKKMKIPRAKTN